MSASQYDGHENTLPALRESPSLSLGGVEGQTGRDSFMLSRVLHNLQPLPGFSLFLGICDDGLPLLLDLQGSSPGSLLILGDRANANLALLRTVMASIAMQEASAPIQVDLVSAVPEAYGEFQTDTPRFDFLIEGSSAVEGLVVNIAAQVHHGRGGRPHGTRLLLFDDLESALSKMNDAAYHALYWVLKYGAPVGLWVLAALHTRDFRKVEDPLLHSFGARVFGKIHPQWLAEYLTGLPGEVSASLTREDRFCTRVAGRITPFWLPVYDLLPGGESFR